MTGNIWKFIAVMEAMILVSLCLDTCMISWQNKENARKIKAIEQRLDVCGCP